MDETLGKILVLAILLGFAVGGILLSAALDEPSAVSSLAPADTSVQAPATTSWMTRYSDWTGDRIAGPHYFGCIYRDHFEELLDYANQGDLEMFSKALATGLATGVCCKFEEGEPVYLIDVVWTGLVTVRRPGEPTEYWTVAEAIGIGE